MKKLVSIISLCLLIGIGVTKAQNQRVVVLECFTSATCGPCASVNPTLDNLINNNSDKLIAVKYHVNWPQAGDPMNLHNPSEVGSKVTFYNVNSVPYSVGDGTWKNLSSQVNQNLINQWAAVESPLEMRMTHYLNATQDTMTVIVMGRATSEIASNNLKLNVAILEKTMTYTSAPCNYSNGERVFHNVMKKMLPGAGGKSIPAMQAGEYFAFKYTWALANVMDINELTTVAWLQDSETKTVYQGCKSSDDFQPYYAKQACIIGIDHTKTTICSGTVDPILTVDNLGSETINTLDINVKLNGNDITTITWNGSLEFGKTVTFDLGELNFNEIAEENEMTFEIVGINGAPDDYQPSVYTYAFEEAFLVVNKSFKLTLRTDDDPQSITWELVNTANGEVVVSGGPYAEASTVYTEEFSLDGDGCYMFTIYDAGGNGLNGGSGFYGLKAGSKTIVSGSSFKDKESNEFAYENYAEIIENQANTASVYPNPSNGLVTIEAEANCTLTVYNTAGQLIYNQNVDGKTVVNMSAFPKGTYLFVLTDEAGLSKKQVIVLQ